MLSWLLRAWRKPKNPGWSQVWTRALRDGAPWFERIEPELRVEFRRQLAQFLATKRFTGARGIAITESMRVIIAAHAVRLTLGIGLGFYSRLSEILVYPDDFVRPGHEDDPLSGETHEWGTVAVSWRSARDGVTLYHEFAHVIDRVDGEFDGSPPLSSAEDQELWQQVMSKHYRALLEGRKSISRVLDAYGAQNEIEFFAVATEAFFDAPASLIVEAPDLYELLSRFYRQDPAAAQSPD